MLRYYTVIIFISIISMLIIQISISKSGTLTRSKKKLFHILFSTIAIAAFCEWMGSCLQGTGGACVVGIYVRDFRLHILRGRKRHIYT